MEKLEYLECCSKQYKDELINNVMPFWTKYGIDREYGGCITCLDRDGSVMDYNKSGWFQGRSAYIYSSMYNHIEQKQEWIDIAKNIIDFTKKHFFDEDNQMFFEVRRDGTPVRKRRYADCENFFAIALSEYSLASGDKSYAKQAVEVFKRGIVLNKMLLKSNPKFREGFVGKSHSSAMILINTAYEIRKAIDDPELTEVINSSINSIRKDFMKADFKALLETVGLEGEFIDSNIGRCINPGHCIETAWFILEEAKYRGWDKELVTMGLTILDWSWEYGWDKEYGGIRYFADCKGLPPQEYWHDMKFWWPQCEAIIATLLAFQATNDDKYLKMHKAINDYTFKHFPDREFGEWFGYIHRDGRLSQAAKGNIFKGPFHIPRMLIKSYLLCNELINKK